MPVSIEDVLALLPEMFPGTQQIPMKNIQPNPNNPGPPLTDLEIQSLAQNIAEVGLLNPIKVWPDKFRPLANGVQLHSSNPRLALASSPLELAQPKSGPQHEASAQVERPWAVGDFNYEILAGENRYRAFDHLKRETIPGSILNPTAKEAVKITHLDNEVRNRGWWAAYQSIEQYIQADPSLTQRQIGIELKMDKPKVTRALALLPLLNPEARALIGSNTPNSNKGIRGISEIAASQLTGLGPGTGLKPGVKAAGAETQKLWPYPPIPPETLDLIRKALEVAIDRGMIEAGVKALVQSIKQGNQPEEFGKASNQNPSPLAGEGRVRGVGETGRVKGAAVASSITGPTPATQTPVKSANAPMEPARPKLGSRLVASARGWWPKVKPFLLNQFKRALGSLLRRWIMTGIGALVVIFLLSPGLYLDLYHVARGYLGSRSVMTPGPAGGQTQVDQPSAETEAVSAQAGRQDLVVPNQGISTHLSSGLQAGRQDEVSGDRHLVPSQGADGYGGTQGDSATSSQLLTSNSGKAPTVQVPPQWKARMEKGGNLVTEFVWNVYATGYNEMNQDLDLITEDLAPDDASGFMKANFPSFKVEKMKQLKLKESFDFSGQNQLLALDGTSETFLVKGVAQLKSDLNQPNQLVAQGPIAIEVRVRHSPEDGNKGKVVWVKTLKDLPIPDKVPAPSNVQKQGSGDDLGKKIGDGIHDLNDAVNKAGSANSAVDKAKNIFGF